MAFVVAGRRSYGRVHTHDGEFADTQFVHINLVPLFPVGSFWVTHQLINGERLGFPIKLHARSIVATYLRTWIAGAAVIAFTSSPSPIAIAVAAVLAALSAWSWTWRSRRGALARRRADFDRAALGTCCDPAWMTDFMRDRLSRELTEQLAGREGARPPDDVARFGARDVGEAILAYGILRLSSVDHRAAGAAADRLLASAFDQVPSDGGPYREGLAGAVPELGAAISAAAQARAASARAEAAALDSTRKPRWFLRRWVQLILLALATPVSIVAFADLAGFSPTAVSSTQLASIHPPVHRNVTVHCDRVDDLGWEVQRSGRVVDRVTFCRIGTHVLVVVSKTGDPETPESEAATNLEGKLDYVPDAGHGYAPWADELHRDPELDARSYDVYLRQEDFGHRRFELLTALAIPLGILACWVLWTRAVCRRRVSARRAARSPA